MFNQTASYLEAFSPPKSMHIFEFLEQQPDIKLVEVGENVTLSDIGDSCEQLIILKSGSVKVFLLNEEGKTITLYYIHPGESCVLTASCILNKRPFPAIATTESASKGYVIPMHKVKSWLNSEPFWQGFIFNLLSERMAELVEIVDQLAFHSIEQRILLFLGKVSDDHNEVQITHQQLADELASSREVISRSLKRLQRENIIDVQRGLIKIL